MKKLTFIIHLILFVLLFTSCKKDNHLLLAKTNSSPQPVSTATYSSVDDFYNKNGVPIQSFTIDAAIGGSYTSPQGSVINIPPNAFVSLSGAPVTGIVTVLFKDIYKKSDMLLTHRTTNFWTTAMSGSPLKSSGEFSLKAMQGNSVIEIAAGRKLTVSLPSINTGGIDTSNKQMPYIYGVPWNCGLPLGGMPQIGCSFSSWNSTTVDTISVSGNNYDYNLYKFSDTATDTNNCGFWFNGDNSSFFSSYLQTGLSIAANDTVYKYNTQVFLIFKGISTVVQINNFWNALQPQVFFYGYAPIGLQCTIVAFGIRNGNLYSYFSPLTTITANQSINFSLHPTNTSAFIAQLQTLN
ncbi:MAG: hypothetical protein ACXVC6_12345 [Bacteroidia bacterium]